MAFWSLYDGGTSSGIYTGVGGPSTTIADTFGPWSKFGEAAINDAGTVAFRADLDVGGSGIFAASGSTINTVVDSSGPFKSFKDPRIGGDGSVAFAGFLDDGQSGIFTGSDPVTDKVVQTGDPLFESTVTGYTALNFFGNVNDSGVLAFWYGLTNGVTGIALAQPAAPFLDADFDEDGDVDGDDLTLWQAGYGSGTLHSQGDADGDGDVDGRDFLTWQRQVSTRGASRSHCSRTRTGDVLAVGRRYCSARIGNCARALASRGYRKVVFSYVKENRYELSHSPDGMSVNGRVLPVVGAVPDCLKRHCCHPRR